MFKTLSFTAKLAAACMLVVLMSIAVLTTLNVTQSKDSLETMGRDSIKAVSDNMHNALVSQHSATMGRVTSDLAYMTQELARTGAVYLSTKQTMDMEITNQVTKQTETVTLPMLKAGMEGLAMNFDIVDKVQQIGRASCRERV